MRAPKILPWIARQTGLDDDLALNLWRRAAGEAEVLCGNCSSSDYYRLAVERLIDLAQEEGERCATGELPSSSRYHWVERYQQRMWQSNLLAAQNAYRLWQDTWMKAITGHSSVAQGHVIPNAVRNPSSVEDFSSFLNFARNSNDRG